jgi:hypothetical protein
VPRRNDRPPIDEGEWFANVLNRGENEQVPRERTNGVGSLDAITMDIARMIEHDEVVDLWDQRQRGQFHPVSRRLYTGEGHQTFEDIRRKYRGDREFQQTVDHYIAEFERFLEEVSGDGRDFERARDYLTSETGKVYTMLAHASGRLE